MLATPERQKFSALLLQALWRRCPHIRCKHLVNQFVQNGPSEDFARSVSLNDLLGFLRKEGVKVVTRACLQRILRLCNALHHGEASAFDTKIFLAAYMIAYRPTSVFDIVGPAERRLMEAALPMLEVFHRILQYLPKQDYVFWKVPAALTKALPKLVTEYMEAFKAWKVLDETRLVALLYEALAALYDAKEGKIVGHEKYSQEAYDQRIAKVFAKLESIAGPAAVQAFKDMRDA